MSETEDFLKRIRELGDRRDQEDEARNRKLEEEILQGKKERQIRRERARSISPTKSSPANTPDASRISLGPALQPSQSLSPTTDFSKDPEPRRDIAIVDAMDQLTGLSNSPTKENSSPRTSQPFVGSESKRHDPFKASPSSAMPSRNSPLSWQRRPSSQTSDHPKSRPLSMVAKASLIADHSSTSVAEPTISRDQIAQSLGTKDPAWFRQTADRGLSSPAYRRNQVEDEERSDHGLNSPRIQMPGMSREGSGNEKPSKNTVDRPSSPSRGNTAFGSSSRASYHVPTISSGLGSPILLTSAPRLDPPSSDSKSENHGLAMSPTQGRISPDRLDRQLSPTKGMGGFVQSAMMKRSESVNKRWSVQSPTGLNRVNSVASNRSTQDPAVSASLGTSTQASVAISRPGSSGQEVSPRSRSRPTSSHSNVTVTQDRPSTASSMRSSITTSTSNDGFIKPPLPVLRPQTPQGLKASSEETTTTTESNSRVETTPPSSPSKTMDTRRWSPTKSSWLETALNKPDSPKPKAIPPPQQPAWMSEMNKAKQKGSVDLGRSPIAGPKHAVNIGGLMRSPPPGALAQPIGLGGLAPGLSSGVVSKNRAGSISSQDTKESLPPTTRASPISSPSGKVKPETPPKRDFRASLKTRQPPPDSSSTGEPEFKNLFGQLRRTKTQNYIAPDELKNNIARGKAALSITGGPKPSVRKDEFKEAILFKKEEFKKAEEERKLKGVKNASGPSNETVIPEALAKRNAMSKSVTDILDLPKATQSPKETPIRPEKESISGTLAGRFNPALAGLLARGPSSMVSNASSRSSSPTSSQRAVSMSTSTTTPDVQESGPQLIHMTKQRARRPKRKAPSTVKSANSTSFEGTISLPTTSLSPKPDNSATKSPETIKPETPLQISQPMELIQAIESPKFSEVVKPLRISQPLRPIQVVKSPIDDENPLSQPPPRKLDMKRRSQFLQEAPNKLNKVEPQLDPPKNLSHVKKANSPEINVKSPSLDTPTITKPQPTTPAKPPSLTSEHVTKEPKATSEPSPISLTQKLSIPAPVETPYGPTSKQENPTLLNSNRRIEKPSPQPSNSVKSVTALWGRSSNTSSPQQPPRPRSPIKLPTHGDEKTVTASTGIRLASPTKTKSPSGFGIEIGESPPARLLPTPPTTSVLLPPRSPSLRFPPSSPRFDDSQVLASFFNNRSQKAERYVVDTAEILSKQSNQNANLKTLQSNLYQLSSDCKKKLAVPSHQDRILFEGSAYVCSHTFEHSPQKQMNELYLWIGDEFSGSTEAAELFAHTEARSSSARLINLRQGKESSEFIQALGGIIVIRRGTANKFDSLAPNILCCRKHMGQVTFDEVDFSCDKLCSGFPYLISTASGKSILWKGKGSGIEELSCAKLIGMEFDLTGEVEEIEDGSEPSSFLSNFVGEEIPESADHWKKKPSYKNYCSRLFCAGVAAKEQIVEISPFCQADLSPSKIYILDAFFEMYIIVGGGAQSQYQAFQNAITFAQEYGILAASMEDRPFVPVSHVVIEGIPRDMKSVFRKWKDGLAPTAIHKTGVGLSRGRSLRIVPLNEAIEVLR